LNSAAGFPLQWFGLFNLPDLAGQDRDLRDAAAELHETMFLVLVGLASIHAAAAFHHHVFLRDATLARMLPRRWLRTGGVGENDNAIGNNPNGSSRNEGNRNV
ncbi:MAG: cytochrome b/b6 domain-containing protein, partial [Luteimonas sp.]